MNRVFAICVVAGIWAIDWAHVSSPASAQAPRPEIRMDYRKGATGNMHLGKGWTPPGEAIGVWTEGPQSELLLPLPPGTKSADVLLNLTAYIVKQRPTQELTLFVGARRIGPYRFDASAFETVLTIPIAAGDIANNVVRIILQSRDPKSPAALGVDPRDNRAVAIALREITIRPR